MSKYGYIKDEAMHPIGGFFKRLFDIIFAFILLIVFLPVIGAIYVAIILEDGKPAFYKQYRIGRYGIKFKIFKFRSMKLDADPRNMYTLCTGENDPRLTKVGRFLRLHHLDELPQLWNVLIGDMSFVGWRPEQEYFVDEIMKKDQRFKYLFQIRPGVTSYATLYNGYVDTLEKMFIRLDYDILYLRTRSFWVDMKILFFTFWNIVTGVEF